ncbi:MAG: hypothetical protein M1820_003065 [Bogoriella megaspora]|nr:MAG: hypothetical protein M1820_003065 [Bogoriella megaspora]
METQAKDDLPQPAKRAEIMIGVSAASRPEVDFEYDVGSISRSYTSREKHIDIHEPVYQAPVDQLFQRIMKEVEPGHAQRVDTSQAFQKDSPIQADSFPQNTPVLNVSCFSSEDPVASLLFADYLAGREWPANWGVVVSTSDLQRRSPLPRKSVNDVYRIAGG